METMYWITRLDAIYIMFSVILAFSIIGTLVFIGAKITNKAAYFETDREQSGKIAHGMIAFVVMLPISAAAVVFIPDTKEALVIYGIGETLEWINENDNANQLPDKAVEALNLYLDNIIAENAEKSIDNEE